MSSFLIYLIGFLIFIAGLAYGAHLLNVPPRWIAVGVVVLLGIGVFGGVAKTKRRDSSNAKP